MAVSGTGLSGSQTFTANQAGNVTFTVTSNATNANTGSTIVARDASGNFSAGTITAALTGNVTGNVSGSSGSCTGNAATATSATSATSATNATNATNLSGGTVAATTITATGNITAHFSDDRLKTRLGNIEDALAKIKTLDTFYYEANQLAQSMGYEPTRDVAVSAQQVQAIMPEVVPPAPVDNQYLTVRYEKLVPLLIAAIKELEAKVALLEAKG
jgi:hypothetical protein